MAAIAASTPAAPRGGARRAGRLAVFLTSDLARCITGQLILADAGAFLSRYRPALPFSHGGGPRSATEAVRRHGVMPKRSRP